MSSGLPVIDGYSIITTYSGRIIRPTDLMTYCWPMDWQWHHKKAVTVLSGSPRHRSLKGGAGVPLFLSNHLCFKHPCFSETRQHTPTETCAPYGQTTLPQSNIVWPSSTGINDSAVYIATWNSLSTCSMTKMSQCWTRNISGLKEGSRKPHMSTMRNHHSTEEGNSSTTFQGPAIRKVPRQLSCDVNVNPSVNYRSLDQSAWHCLMMRPE